MTGRLYCLSQFLCFGLFWHEGCTHKSLLQSWLMQRKLQHSSSSSRRCDLACYSAVCDSCHSYSIDPCRLYCCCQLDLGAAELLTWRKRLSYKAHCVVTN
jgi:hypothetical protein